MAWSKFQNKIFEYAVNPDNGSFCVSAVAGSGKTVTSVECAKRIAASKPGCSIRFFAFNKSIAEELQQRTEGFDNIQCSTLHSFGFSCLRRSKMRFTVNDRKWKMHIKKNVHKYLDGPIEDRKIYQFIRNCETLVNLCRINMVSGNDMTGIVGIISKHNVNCVANEAEAVSRMMKKSNDLFMFKTKQGIEIDYTDMITMPLSDSFRKFIVKSDIVFIDEAQDLSEAQQQLMLQAVKKDGKFIAVGDKFQSINGFAGSLCDSFDKLVSAAGGTVLPLSVNYRCGKKIIQEAQKIMKDILPYEESGDGEIVHQKDLKDVKSGDMVICRKTAPLISLTLRLIGHGKSAYIKGRDIANAMKDLIEQTGVEDDNNLSMDHLFVKLDNNLDELKHSLVAKGIKDFTHHPAYVNMVDKIKSLQIIASNCTAPSDVLALLDRIFDDQVRGDAIMLSTVHKAKGLESDTVYIVAPELLPMRYKNQQQWEYEQEMNLKYVAITRAKQRLVWVDVPELELETVDL